MADQREAAVGGASQGDESVRAMLERAHDPARVLALSDGVFAIIITLLVLEVHVPELTQGHSLNAALAELRPSLIAFVISFILAGMYWVAHRDLFALSAGPTAAWSGSTSSTCCRCACCRSAPA